MASGKKCYYVFNLSIAIVESIVYGGIFAGWPAIEYMFKKDGRFGLSCEFNVSSNLTSANIESDMNDCTEQDNLLGLVYIISLTSMMLLSYITGYIFDKYGTWVSRAFGTIIFNIGCLFLSETGASQSWALFPGCILMAVGGISFAITPNTQMGNLFGEWRSSVITLLVGCFQSASVTAVIIKLVYEAGISSQNIFRFMNYLTALVWFRTFFLMPRMYIPYPLPKEGFVCGLQKCFDKYLCGETHNKDAINMTQPDESNADSLLTKENDINKVTSENAVEKADVPSYSHCITTPMFWGEVFHYFILHFRNVLFVSSFLVWVGKSFDLNAEEQGSWVNTFVLLQSTTIFLAPLNGVLIDLLSKKFTTSGFSPRNSSAKAIFVSKTLTSVMACLFSIVVCIPILMLQYVAFVFLLLYRSFLYGVMFTFFAILYPKEHFGKLTGFISVLVGLLQLIQDPIKKLISGPLDYNYLPVNIAFCVLCFLTLFHPVYYYVKFSKKEPSKNYEQTSLSP